MRENKHKFEKEIELSGYTIVGDYINGKEKVDVVCANGHHYSTSPTNFIRGYRCAQCSGVKIKTGRERAREAQAVHGDRYEYSAWLNVGDVSAATKLPVHCKACDKSWTTSVDNHIRGRGCPNCRSRIAKINRAHNEARLLNVKYDRMETYLARAKSAHGDFYDYSLVDMFGVVKGAHDIRCPTHGVFSQSIYNHSVKKSLCPECQKSNMRKRHGRSAQDTLSALKEVHPTYEFVLGEKYINAKSKIEASCREHGVWVTSVDSLLSGSGCPACKGHSQRYFYINSVDDGFCIKYGIARDVEFRLNRQNSKNKLKMQRLLLWGFSEYSDCRDCESKIKKLVSPVLSASDMIDGWTETAPTRQLDMIVRLIEESGGVRV